LRGLRELRELRELRDCPDIANRDGPRAERALSRAPRRD